MAIKADEVDNAPKTFVNGIPYNERLRRAIIAAREEAVALHHQYIGPEHLLLGLLRERDGVAVAALRELNADLGDMRAAVHALVLPGTAGAGDIVAELPFTLRARKVLDEASAEARNANHTYVGTEHLLLGFLREANGVAARVLTSAGVSLDVTRKLVRHFLGESEGPVHDVQNVRAIIVLVTMNDGSVIARQFATAAEASNYLIEG